MEYDSALWLLMIIIPLIAEIYVQSTYNKYKNKKNTSNITGYDVARKILDKNVLYNLYIVETQGTMTYIYDVTRKTIKLSSEVYHGSSIASLAIAAHECGHAIQDKNGYSFFKFRSTIFPIVNIGTRIAWIVLLIGFIFQLIDLVWVGILLVGLGLIFELVTLPVEFNASNRALENIQLMHLINDEGIDGTKQMLTSAALTYVAAVLSTMFQMLRLIMA